jgi:hypothetical protein
MLTGYDQRTAAFFLRGGDHSCRFSRITAKSLRGGYFYLVGNHLQQLRKDTLPVP